MTVTYELGKLVAERQLESITEDGARALVVVRIGMPTPDPLSTNGDWCCPHQILGLGEDAVDASFGVDSLQALLLSVHGLQLKLTDRAKAASVELDWLGMPDFGLRVDPGLEQLMNSAPHRGTVDNGAG